MNIVYTSLIVTGEKYNIEPRLISRLLLYSYSKKLVHTLYKKLILGGYNGF